MNNKKIADLIFPNIDSNLTIYEKKYPRRDLDDTAIVTRFAPSPTGFVHMGSLRTALIGRKITKDTNGVFFVRIEDTDVKRSVPNGITGIIKDLEDFDITVDEGRINEKDDIGNYGPYLQTERISIYKSFAKKMLEEDLAYPCFCSEEDLDNLRTMQESKKARIGYYGKYAKCRRLTIDDISSKIKKGEKFTIRLKSKGNFENKIKCKDLVKGTIEFPENDLDIVLLKSDFVPTYHFAHVVDDYLMRTTHILRGDEWLSSYPVHHEIFKLLNLKLPVYCHIAPVNKKENDITRKLSKRKDPEAAVSYYHEKGIPVEAVKLYLMTTANSNFEEWLMHNPKESIDKFKFDFKKMSASGSIFDLDKLINISKNYIANLSAEEVYNKTLDWSEQYDVEFHQLLLDNKDYSINILDIERNINKPRKDFAGWSFIKENIFYMYDDLFNNSNIEITTNNYNQILNDYIDNYYNDCHDKKTWFENMKKLADKYNFASNMKEYKATPEKFIGSIADLSNLIRVVLTTKTKTPDLYQIMQLLGKEKIKERFNSIS